MRSLSAFYCSRSIRKEYNHTKMAHAAVRIPENYLVSGWRIRDPSEWQRRLFALKLPPESAYHDTPAAVYDPASNEI
jgi:hypothetical protein